MEALLSIDFPNTADDAWQKYVMACENAKIDPYKPGEDIPKEIKVLLEQWRQAKDYEEASRIWQQ